MNSFYELNKFWSYMNLLYASSFIIKGKSNIFFLSLTFGSTGQKLIGFEKYEDYSEGNVKFYYVHQRCWWYGSKTWTFPLKPHNFFLICYICSLAKWHLTWKCMYHWISPCIKNYIYCHFQNVFKDQTVDMNTVMWWVACFSSHDVNVCDKQYSRQSYRVVSPQNKQCQA